VAQKQRSRTLITLGQLVRVHRDALGWTQKELAGKLGYTNGWLSNVELGQLRPRAEQVRAIERALKTPSGALMEVYEQLDGESLPGWMRNWTSEEGAAEVLRWVELYVVPGLLQTEDYARALLKGNEDAVRARMKRQEVLTHDDPPAAHFVLDETVLLHEIGGAQVMQAQLAHLINSVRENLTIQVVRSSKNPHSLGSFIIATSPEGEVAYVETALRGIVTSSRDDVADLSSKWEFIRTFALPQEESIELIKKIAEERWQ
jgi:transcriptional regulator with XRE-family HTH domain